MLEGPRDDAPLGGGIVDALHGEALAAAGLPVREDGAVVALQHTLGQIQTVSGHCYQTLLSIFGKFYGLVPRPERSRCRCRSARWWSPRHTPAPITAQY